MAGQVNLGHVVGADGIGVPAGGSTGQALVKKSGSDFDSEWKTLNTVPPESIAIVVNGNTHGAIENNRFVYVRGQANLADGLYKSTVAIPANEALTTSNVTPVSGGGLNETHHTFERKIRQYSSVTIPSDGYIKIDSFDDMGVDHTKFLISMMFRGWEAHLENLTLAKSTYGVDIYMLGPAGTTATNVSVEYFFVDRL